MKHEITKPTLRKEPKKIERTVILLTGFSMDGKSYLSSKLINDDIDFISMDGVASFDTKNEKIEKFKKNFKCPDENVDKINNFINNYQCNEFIDFLFNEYIDKCSKNTILLEGHIFLFQNILNGMRKKCKETSTRMWVLYKENL